MLWRDGWRLVRLPVLLPGALLAWVAKEPAAPNRAPSRWRHFHDEILARWDRHALDRYVIRALAWPVVRDWESTDPVADRALRLAPITSMRQLYLLGCYSLLGISVLAKGPPGLAVVGAVGVFYVVAARQVARPLRGRVRAQARHRCSWSSTFLPWHLAMCLKEGVRFIDEYLFTHILNRAAVGAVDNSLGTFEYYTSQLGHGMWLWAALMPAALAAALLRARTDYARGPRAVPRRAVGDRRRSRSSASSRPSSTTTSSRSCRRSRILVAFFLDDILARPRPPAPALRGARHRHRAARRAAI